MVNAAEAALLYPISNEEEQPLLQSTTLPVTCNMTVIGLPASSTPATASAGRRLLAATNTSRGLQTADIHCSGSYNVTIVGGPALQTFSSKWTGGIRNLDTHTANVRKLPRALLQANCPSCSMVLSVLSTNTPSTKAVCYEQTERVVKLQYTERSALGTSDNWVLQHRCELQPGRFSSSRSPLPGWRQRCHRKLPVLWSCGVWAGVNHSARQQHSI